VCIDLPAIAQLLNCTTDGINGFRDVPIDRKRPELYYDVMKACFIDQACRQGIAEPSEDCRTPAYFAEG
jgi:hypothetical protein